MAEDQVEQAMAEDQASTMFNDEILNPVSNSYEYSSHNRFGFLNDNGMVELQGIQYNTMKNIFLGQMGPLASQTSVVAAKFGSNFHNAKYIWGWYGASKDDISAILSHGFTRPDEPVDGRSHGVVIHLSSPICLLDEVLHSTPDEEGIRHILACRVITGKTEVISDGTKQYRPSSVEFDTGVDHPLAPTKYIVWSAHMNSYLKLDNVIGFKSPTLKNYSRAQLSTLMPAKPLGITLCNLIPILERLFEPSKFHLISKE